MSDITNPRFLCIPLLLLAIPFFVQRLFRAPDRANRQFVAKLLIITVLFLIPSYNVYLESVHRPMQWWQYTLGNVVLHAIILLQYFVTDQLINSHIPKIKAAVKHSTFQFTISFSLLMIIIDFSRRNHFASVTDPEVFERSLIYLLAQISYNAPLIYTIFLMIAIYQRSLSRYQDISFVIRHIVVISGLAVAVGIMVLALINTIISLVINNPYRVLVYSLIQNVGRPTVFLLVILGVMLPQRFYSRILRSHERILEQRQQEQLNLLRFLHARMIQIAPSIHLQNEQLRDLRLLTEIDDAREMIWSQVPRTQPITPDEEAQHLFDLLRSNQTVEQPGEYMLPAIRGDAVKHHLSVAKQLQQLERGGGQVTNQSEVKLA